MTHPDFDFDQIIKRASELIEAGCTVHQKFTCQQCGNRLTMETPNKFYKEGTCDRCGYTSNIEESGCNYLVVMPI